MKKDKNKPVPEEEKELQEAAETETAGEKEPDAETAAEKPAEEAADEKSAEAREPEKDPLKEAEDKIAELTDRLQRQMAEFENFRKRTEKEKTAMFDMGSRNVIEKILPVIDNFERGLAGVPEEAKDDPFVTGMDKVYKQLMKELTELGVKSIEALGQPFDPSRHNAVMHVEDETVDENTIVEEFQKGYTYRDTIVRYSMVKVAN